MAKKIGICRNDDCDLMNQEQEAEEFDFVCSSCGHELMETIKVSKELNWKLIAIIVAVVVVIAVGLCYALGVFDGESSPKVDNPKEEIIDTTEIKKKDTTTVDTTTKVSEPVTNNQQTDTEKKTKKTPPPPPVVNGYGTYNFGYAKYEGQLKNGKPHGAGTLTYTTSHKIFPSKDYVASPGDIIENAQFGNGVLRSGNWHHAGTEEWIKN